ncbi:hypothetical protein [Roseiconus nitratireducens]|uniref:hypothetical protein n=1 Tax=Roseiconus nitratireducens TaxID=2605748 RepID=UPI001F20DA71|nr:hypothetical protein [Roseiconus nitratireducens]
MKSRPNRHWGEGFFRHSVAPFSGWLELDPLAVDQFDQNDEQQIGSPSTGRCLQTRWHLDRVSPLIRQRRWSCETLRL